jgi:mRNA interferase HigB
LCWKKRTGAPGAKGANPKRPPAGVSTAQVTRLTKFPKWELYVASKVDRMRIISRKKLREFWKVHRATEKSPRAWFHETKVARWKNFNDIKKQYPSADVVSGNRVIFDIKGNHYRLVVKIHYNTGVVFIRFVGTHKQYDQIDPNTV